MSGAQGSRTVISFSTAPGEGYNLMRQALVRMVLAVEQAAVHRRSWSPGWGGELSLALAPICPTPHVSAEGHPAEGLAWSRLIDVDHLAQGTRVRIDELEELVAAHPSAPWRVCVESSAAVADGRSMARANSRCGFPHRCRV